MNKRNPLWRPSIVVCSASLLMVIAAWPRLARGDVPPDGSFSHSVPIGLPPGTNAMAPKLSVDYSSAAGNGPLGFGWQLSGIPTIGRINFGAGIHYQGADTYAGPGGRLMPINDAKNVFHTVTENWDQYLPQGTCGDGPCSWIMRDPRGLKMYFGTTDDSRIERVGSASVRVWALARVEDQHGNYYDVSYAEDEANGSYYPTKIAYTKGNGLAAQREVAFDYEERTDPRDRAPSYAQSAREAWTKRMKWIRVTSAGEPVRAYRLDYEQSNTTGRSRLVAVQEYGSDLTSTLPAQRFKYTDVVPQGLTDRPRLDATLGSPTDYTHLSGDIDGDGRPDWARVAKSGGGGAQIALASGIGAVVNWVFSSTEFGPSSDYEHQLADVNGDGKVDWIQISKTTNMGRVGLATGGGAISTWSYSTDLVGAASSHEHQLIDVTGDSRADWIEMAASTGRIRVAVAKPDGTFAPWTWSSEAIGKGDDWVHRFADITGDGYVDLIEISKKSEDTRLWASRGDGAFDLIASPSFGSAEANAHYHLDLNGDGSADWLKVSVSSGQSAGFLSKGDGTFEEIGGDVIGAAADWSHHFAEINGDGFVDIVRVSKTEPVTGEIAFGGADGRFASFRSFPGAFGPLNNVDYHQTDLDGDGLTDWVSLAKTGEAAIFLSATTAPPDLLTWLDNGLGGTTAIDYRPAPMVTDAVTPTLVENGVPNTSPRPLVTRVIAGDGRGALHSTRYEYGNGRVLPGAISERADLGFAVIRTVNEQAATTSVSRYRQDKPYETQLEEVSEYAANGQLIGRTTYLYKEPRYCDEGGCSTDRNPTLPRQILASKITTLRYELGHFLFSSETEVLAHDAYGNATMTAARGPDGPEDDSFLLRDFINDPDKRVIGLQYRERSCGEPGCDGVIFKQQETRFDGAPLGNMGERGLVTSTREWMGRSVWASSSYAYDVHGNRTSNTDPNGVTTKAEFDSQFHSFRVRSFTRNQLVAAAAFDHRYGVATEATDANGVKVKSALDVFGHPQGRITEKSGKVLRKESYASVPGNPISSHTICKHYGADFARSLCTTEYKDGMGRTFQSASQGPNGAVLTDIEYDAAGRESRRSVPHEAGGPIFWTTNGYDVAGRISSVTLPDGKAIRSSVSIEGLAPGARYAEITTTEGNSVRTEKNARGLTVRKTEGILDGKGGAAVDYAYNRRGDLVKVTAPGGVVTSISYDEVGRKLKVVDANAGTTSWSYDDTPGTATFGKVVKVTTSAHDSSKGVSTTTNCYDPFGRISATQNSDGSGTKFTYDDAKFVNGVGRLTGVEDRPGGGYVIRTSYAYDDTGAISDTFERISGPGVETTYHYAVARDELGRDDHLTYPDGSIVTQTYAGWGGLDETYYSRDAANPTDASKRFAKYSGYDSTGHIGKVDRLNGTRSVYTYEPATGKVVRATTTNANSTLLDWTYAFDPRGNVKSITDQVLPELSWGYGYDPLDRLISADRGDVAMKFGFDEAGNLTNLNGVRQDFVPGTHRLKATKNGALDLSYSASGNVVRKGDQQLRYNAMGKLSEVTNKKHNGVRYFYRHDGTRFLKVYEKNPGITIKTYYLGNLFEVRERWECGKLMDSQTTKFVSGPGGDRLASITEGDSLASFNQKVVSGNHYALAGMMSTGTVGGLANKAIQLAAGFFTSPRGMKAVQRSILVGAFAAALLVWVLFVLRARTAPRLAPVFFLDRFRAGLIPRSVPVIMAFIIFVCSACSNGRAVSEGTEADSALLVGDTSTGRPLGTFFFHTNHLNSSSLITDMNGAEVLRLNYLPYGELDQENSGRLFKGKIKKAQDVETQKFAGQEYDPESSLYYYQSRYYDPTTGTFLSADSDPGASGPQAYNRYGYAEGNPVNFTDPTGHRSWRKFFKAIVTVVVAIVVTVVAVVFPPAAIILASVLVAYSAYRGYRAGGWRGAIAAGVSAAANAALAYFHVPMSVSVSYTYAGGWGYGVGVGNNGVGVNVGYSERGGTYVGAGYTGTYTGGTTLGAQYSANGGWTGTAEMNYNSYGATITYGFTWGEGGRSHSDWSSDYTAANFVGFMQTVSQDYGVRGAQDTSNASVGGISTDTSRQNAIGRDANAMVIGNPPEGFLRDVVQCTFGKLPVIGPIAGLLTNPSVLVLTTQIMSGKVTHIDAHSQGAIIASNALWLAALMGHPVSNISVSTYGGAAMFFPPGVSTSHHVFHGDWVGKAFGGRSVFRSDTHFYPAANGFSSLRNDGAVTGWWSTPHGWGQNGDGRHGYTGVINGSIDDGP